MKNRFTNPVNKPLSPTAAALGLMVALVVSATLAPRPVAAESASLSVAGAPDLAQVRPLELRPPADGAAFVLHYHRPDGDYRGWNVWIWRDGHDGQALPFTGEDAFGVYATLPLPDAPPQVNFIVRRGEWQDKDVSHDRSVPVDDHRIAEAWLISGDPTVYTAPDQLDFDLKLRAAFLDADDRVRLTLSHEIDPAQLDPDRLTLRQGDQTLPLRRVRPADDSSASRRASRRFDLFLQEPVDLHQLHLPLTLQIGDANPQTVRPRDVLDDPALSPTDVELGPDYSQPATTFRTWSPTAQAVELLIYQSPDASQPDASVQMSRAEHGIWETTVAGDLHGTYYQLRFTHGDQATAVPDIHAYAASPDSLRSMVVDLDRTDPDGFRDHPVPASSSMTDQIIYEIHVRDFSIADPSVPTPLRGKYPGLVQPGGDRPTTSLQHLKDLGVTAVHLLPIQDFSNARHDYNWGYWTTLFNVPESDYSTTPHDPAATIRELKQTIQTLHENDIRVILDVVYNHTSITDHPSPFETTTPNYYFRTTDDGSLRNDAGTGNSIADERAMVRQYILDSLTYWSTEYRVDGFRFDLLGTHHPETVAAITRQLRKVRPDLTIYGEPWTGGGPTYFPPGAQRGLGIAVFNDRLRNAVRGDLDGQATGFATGPGGDVDALRRNLTGALDEFADAPTESVSYVSAHDNRTFWDKLQHTHPHADEDTKLAMHKLAHGIVLTSQGIAFLHGGADFARTKQGNHNSYNAGDAVNALDWPRKAHYHDLHDYLRGLIALRRTHPAFRMTSAPAVRSGMKFLDSPDGTIAYTLDGAAVGDDWDSIAVIYNGSAEPRDVPLPRGRWNVVVDHQSAGNTTLHQENRRVTLPPYSLWVGHRD